MADLTSKKKRRGTAKGSITHIHTRLSTLEKDPPTPATLNTAKHLLKRLNQASEEFIECHRAVVDLIDNDAALAKEQDQLDEVLDTVGDCSVRLLALIDSIENRPRHADEQRVIGRKLARLEKLLISAKETIKSWAGCTVEIPVLKQHEEQLQDYKRELAEVNSKLFELNVDDGHDFVTKHAHLEQELFTTSLQIKKEMDTRSTPAISTGPPSAGHKGMKLPKLETPTFNGNVLSWRKFWEQFSISVHDRSDLSESEKLVYLQQAVKAGSAKSVIEGLSHTGDDYQEAVKCLFTRYNRPRVIHQAHVKTILEIPPLKEGTGKEIRKLHDTLLQHLRALRSMGSEPSGPFITSAIELKLDKCTMFEWQKHSQKHDEVPHYEEILVFLDLRARATESIVDLKNVKQDPPHHKHSFSKGGNVASHASNAELVSNQCILCKPDKHPLYSCPRFRDMSHESKINTVKSNGLCMNCLTPNHFVKQCTSTHRCKRCQRPHHTLLHTDGAPHKPASLTMNPSALSFTPNPTSTESVSSNTAIQLRSNALLMTSRVLVYAPDGTAIEARALLDNASSASFVSARMAQCLRLPRVNQKARISGVAGLSHQNSNQSVTNFYVTATRPPFRKINVTAIIVPKVTCDLPFSPIAFNKEWEHLDGIDLADPEFGVPGKVDLLLGVDVFVDVILHGRRSGPPGMPIAFETGFGWVLAGNTDSQSPLPQIATFHVSCTTGDELLRKFWEIEDSPLSEPAMSPEERCAIQHFKSTQSRTAEGRFVVPLPKRADVKALGESRSHAAQRFLSLERTLHSKNQFNEFRDVMREYFKLKHAELVPYHDLNKPTHSVFYLPVHVISKPSSTTTKIRAVFDASAKSSSGVSLNDMLMVGPTVHASLIEVLLRFRMHRIAIVADVSKMYRAIELTDADRDLHRFVWRERPEDTLQDYRMTRLTFGISSSSFIANMAVKQNAEDHTKDYPLAAKVVEEAFYVDDCLTGADSVHEGLELRRQLQELFTRADFTLRKWNSSNPQILRDIPPELRDEQTSLTITEQSDVYSKTLGIEWHCVLDYFRINTAKQRPHETLTKRALVSEIASIYDVLGFVSPVVIKAKILLQRVWESKVDWDEEVPQRVFDEWSIWHSQLESLSKIHIPRYYFPKEAKIESIQLHGFSDASQCACAAVAYLRMVDNEGQVHVSLVASKTKVAPLKRLTIPRLELCGAYILTKLLEHIRSTLNIPIESLFAWTDSTVVLNWLDGNPNRFRTYVGNRISFILDHIPTSRWRHVPGESNPADCASRGLFPDDLIEHDLWWNGPSWLKSSPSEWPTLSQEELNPSDFTGEVKQTCHVTIIENGEPIIPLDRFSSYTKLIRITAWMMRFLCNIKRDTDDLPLSSTLSVPELVTAETYWLSYSQRCFEEDISRLKSGKAVRVRSPLASLHPFIDSVGLLRVSGRAQMSKLAYTAMHPVILSGKHQLTKLIIRSEHIRLLHGGPTLVISALNARYHIIGGRKSVRSVVRKCIICLRRSERPKPQQMGQLPVERVHPDIVFENTGVDYAGPVYTKFGYVRKPTVVKSYICIFVSLTVRAVHIELVSDLTTEAFISALRRFIARRGKPKVMLSDHGTNFVGAKNELKDLEQFLTDQQVREKISRFCTSQRIEWKLIPEKAPHFGGLWEATVKSTKHHIKRVIGETKLTFEEYSTVLSQIEACLNSRPLVVTPSTGEGIDTLTPGHFLIGRPLMSLPDSSRASQPVSLLKRWYLCQNLVRRFWQLWSRDYLVALRKHHKWHHPRRNLSVGDIAMIQDDKLVTPCNWPLGRIIDTYCGADGLVRVVKLQTQHGTYVRPVTKVALLLQHEE